MTETTNAKKPRKPKKKGSGIEWTGETWNPVVGCTPVSQGCLNCYAASMARRLEAMGRPEYRPIPISDIRGEPPNRVIRIAEVRGGRAVFTSDVRTVPDRLDVPLKRRAPTVWFVNSMSDLFHEAVPFEFIDRVFAVMALCPQHTFQVLTKRPERMAEYFAGEPWRRLIEDGISDQVAALRPDTALQWHVRKIEASEPDGSLKWPLPNVWLGTSVEDQPRADERIPHLLRCPAAVRFLSCEPLLGAVDLSEWLWAMDGTRRHSRLNQLHWVITGGESGPDTVRREVPVECITGVADQCLAAGVPVFIKQDSGRKPGQHGRIPDKYWALKQMPEVLK